VRGRGHGICTRQWAVGWALAAPGTRPSPARGRDRPRSGQGGARQLRARPFDVSRRIDGPPPAGFAGCPPPWQGEDATAIAAAVLALPTVERISHLPHHPSPQTPPPPRGLPPGFCQLSPPPCGGDGAPIGAIRMVAADDRPPQGVLRRPRLSAPRGNGVAWVPVLPLAICGPARFPRLSRRRRYSLASPLPVTLPPPSRRPGTPLVVAAGGFTHDPPEEGVCASSPAAGHRRPPRGHRYASGCAPPSGRQECGWGWCPCQGFYSYRGGWSGAFGSRQSAVDRGGRWEALPALQTFPIARSSLGVIPGLVPGTYPFPLARRQTPAPSPRRRRVGSRHKAGNDCGGG